MRVVKQIALERNLSPRTSKNGASLRAVCGCVCGFIVGQVPKPALWGRTAFHAQPYSQMQTDLDFRLS